MKALSVVVVSLVIVMVMVLGTGCPAKQSGKKKGYDPAETKRWAAALEGAKTTQERRKALSQLQRLFQLLRAAPGSGPSGTKAQLAEFRKVVSPTLVRTLRKKVNDRYLGSEDLVEKLVLFEADDPEATALFLEIIHAHAAGKTPFCGDDAIVESLVGNAVEGLSGQAARGKGSAKGLKSLSALAAALHKPGAAEKLDPRSVIRRGLVGATGHYAKRSKHRTKHLSAVAGILAQLVLGGQRSKGQDPLVTISAIGQLGDTLDISPRSVEALVVSLFGKARGRRFFEVACSALAKLPLENGARHPAVAPLLLLLKGDPWKHQLAGGSAPEGLKRQYRKKRTMPKCPYPKYPYVCQLFWRANVEDWTATEPGVIPMNALLALREIGDLSTVAAMLEKVGWQTLRRQWLAQSRNVPGTDDKKDKTIPGVLMQKMMVMTYGEDLNLRMDMLRALGRMGAVSGNLEVQKELKKSLTWSGDPSMLVAAGEAISLARFDKILYGALVGQITRHASIMSVNSKMRQVKMFFWGKAVKGTCPQGKDMEEKFRRCLEDPPKMPGQREVEDANWNCFWRFRKFWLAEFYYAIGYHQASDLRRLVQPYCQKTDTWWNRRRPRLLKQVQAGGPEGVQARLQLFACAAKPTTTQLAWGQPLRCGVWSHCNKQNNHLCLSPYWNVRMRFYGHAALLAPAAKVDALLRMSSVDLMGPHGLKAKWLPRRDKSAFYDSDDKMYLNSFPWPAAVEEARLKKASAILEQRLCEAREGLWVVKECGADLACYVAVARRKRRVPTEACDKLGPGPRKKLTSRSVPGKKAAPSWRARRKALRMVALLGSRHKGDSPQVKQAVGAAVEIYGAVSSLPNESMLELRKMALLVLDRLGDPAKHRKLTCTARLPQVSEEGPTVEPDWALYRHKLRIARIHQDKASIARYERLLGPARQAKANAKANAKPLSRVVTMPCFALLRDLARREIRLRRKGAWQINRDAQNTLGRLARRAKVRYGAL